GAQSALEDQCEGVLIRYVEKAQGADRHMDVNRVQPFAEDALGAPTGVNVAHGIDGRTIQVLDGPRFGQVPAIVNVFVHDQTNKVRIAGLVVKREGNELAHGLFRGKIRQMQVVFDAANTPIRLFQDSQIQFFL